MDVLDKAMIDTSRSVTTSGSTTTAEDGDNMMVSDTAGQQKKEVTGTHDRRMVNTVVTWTAVEETGKQPTIVASERVGVRRE
jgi:hypothetical protein